MPTYVYECDEGHRFEKVERITADAMEECEEMIDSRGGSGYDVCGAPCHRVPQPSRFVLLGAGWAREGYQK